MNSQSSHGSIASSSCNCNQGFTGANGEICAICDENTYKSVTGSASCTACPLNSQSPSGSVALSTCICNEGFTGPDGGNCTICESDTFKSVPGSAACTACPYNSQSPTGSTASSNCICKQGYTGPNLECKSDPFWVDNGGDGCKLYDANAAYCADASDYAVNGVDATHVCCACGCWFETHVETPDFCSVCQANTYKSVPGSSPCKTCPPNSQSPRGSTALTSCTCNEGFTGPNGGDCAICGSNTYTSPGSAICTACPANSQSASGSTTARHCTCNQGFTGPNGESCTACAYNTYKSDTGSANCTACPLNSQSANASTALSKCICNQGYTGSDGGICSPCGFNTYKSVPGSASCQPCHQEKVLHVDMCFFTC